MVNDLEPPVMRRHPEIRVLTGQLRELGAIASAMSGSGSAVFGLFTSRAAAQRAVKPLSRNGAKALVTRTLTRGEYERRGRAVARKSVFR
jgi:4-diphosphocytidyl-2-C-methyl-D-erythritol kinase